LDCAVAPEGAAGARPFDENSAKVKKWRAPRARSVLGNEQAERCNLAARAVTSQYPIAIRA
jgi:hypothetical protein